MIRRWFIRGLALTLLTLCVVAWVEIYWRFADLSYSGGLGERGYSLELDGGRILVFDYFEVDSFGISIPRGWKFYTERYAPETDRARGIPFPYEHRFLGFGVEPWSWVAIPLWFPTLLLMGLNWHVWRKTRPRPVGKAFPVEPAAPAPPADGGAGTTNH